MRAEDGLAVLSPLSDHVQMAMKLTDTAAMAAGACERLADSIRNGFVVVTKLSLVDEERTVLVVEAMPVDDQPVQGAAPQRAAQTTVASMVALLTCPRCKAAGAECRDLGRGDIICMKCNFNWNAAQAERSET